MSDLLDRSGNKLENVKVAVAIPSHENVPVTFAYDAMQMMAFTASIMPEDVELGVTLVSGTYIHSARQQLLEHLLDTGVTHILWLDSDMRFPREALVRLMGRDKDFVGINYAKREVPTSFVGIKRGSWHREDDIGEMLHTNEDSEGLESVDALGFGVFLMRTAALNGLPEKPWFWFEEKFGHHIGEDVYFCRIVKEKLGHQIWCDHDLSHECAHIGSFEYRVGHAEDAINHEVA